MREIDDSRDPLLELSPFDLHYGLELVEYTDELVRGRVRVREELTQPLGLVHGGVHAAIAEGLASLGTNHGVAADGMVGLGMSNESSFLRPVGRGRPRDRARRRHRGGRRGSGTSSSPTTKAGSALWAGDGRGSHSSVSAELSATLVERRPQSLVITLLGAYVYPDDRLVWSGGSCGSSVSSASRPAPPGSPGPADAAGSPGS